MAGPNQAEKSKVSKVKDIKDYRGQDHIGKVVTITSALGFDNETRARLIRNTLKRSQRVFAGKEIFSGKLLAHIASELSLKPDTFLGLRNFDLEQSPVSGERWNGPPKFFVTGDAEMGRDLVLVISRTKQRQLLFKQEIKTIKEIEDGKSPAPIDLVRELVSNLGEVESVALTYDEDVAEAYRRLYENCFLRIPNKVRTVSQVFLPPLAEEVSDEVRKQLEGQYNTPGHTTAAGMSSVGKTPAAATEPTTEEAVMADAYEQAFVEKAIGAEVARLAEKVGKRNVYLKLEGRTANAGDLARINAGQLVVGEEDLRAFVEAADQAGFGQSQEVVTIDAFWAQINSAQNDSMASENTTAKVDETEEEEPPGDTSAEVSDGTAAEAVDADTSSETATEVVWDGESVTIRGTHLSFEPKHPNRKLVFETMVALKEKYSLSLAEIERRMDISAGLASSLRYGNTFINQERAEGWADALGLTVPQLLGVDPLPEIETVQSEADEDAEAANGAAGDAEATSDESASEPEAEETEVGDEDGTSENEEVTAVAETADAPEVEADSSADTDESGVSAEPVTEEAAETPSASNGAAVRQPHPVVQTNGSASSSGLEWLVGKLVEDVWPHIEGVSTDAEKALGFLAKMAKGGVVTVEEAYPAWQKRLAAEQALQELAAADPEEYRKFLSGLH